MLRFVRSRLAALSLLGGLAGVAGGGLTACPGTATQTLVAPMEGVTLHLADVLGSLRCGTGPGDVYKYTVVVWAANPEDAASTGATGDGGEAGTGEAGPAGDAGGAGEAGDAGDAGGSAVTGASNLPLFSNVFDCFSDAVLDNLGVDGGSMQFFLRVYAYSYEGALAASGSADGNVSEFGPFWCQGGLGANGASCQFQDASTAYDLGDKAQWSTTCTATEPFGAPITAVCAPLEPVVPSSGDAAAEAAPDATTPGPDASGDAGEASSPAPDATGPDSAAESGASDSSAQESSTEGGD